MESIKAPILYPEGIAPIVEPLQSGSPSPPRNTVTFDLPHRHPTRLSDIDEEKEHEQDDAGSCGSWEDLTSNNVHADEYEKHVEGSFSLKKDYKEFHRAASLGKLDILNEKLDLGLEIDSRTSTGFTALVIAIWEMQVDAVKLLLDRGADPHLRVNELPPLVHAASRTDRGPELVQLLMDHGAILTATSKPDHRNVLHCASAVGTPETVEFLVSKAHMDMEKKCRRGCTPLLVAARAGNVENAKVLLRLGADLNALSLNGGSALIWSSCWENLDAIKFWLEQGADINARDNNGRTSLYLACHYGSLETVTLLLENGADTSIPDSDTDEISALMAAVLSDDPAIIRALAAHGCDLNYKNTEGETALDVAILGKRLKAVETLLELQGGDFYPKQSVALQIALSGGHEMVKSLITTVTLMYPYVAEHFSSDLGWLDWLLKEGGDLVRSRACFKILHVALEEQDIDLITALAKQGCNFDVQLESGHTPLSFAVGHRNIELIQTLLELGADINVPRANREELIYPFDDAILDMENGSDTEVVDLLLKSGRCRINQGKNPANTAFHYVLSRAAEMPHSSWDSLALRMVDAAPDVNDDKCAIGCGLLHIATLRGREDIIDRLWLKGADLEATDKLGVTPLILACQHAPAMIPVLLARGANVNAKYKAEAGVLAAAASHGRTASLAELINKSGMDMEVKTESGYTPLACALTWAQERAALYLMHKGADVHWKTQPREQTALHFAAKYNLEVVMEQLLKKGLDVNARDSEGWMPLHEACALAEPKLVQMLLDAGADIEAALPNADRPLHVALINEQQDIASLLVSRGASLTARASKNRTPLHLCAEYSLGIFGRSLLSKGVSTEDIDDETWTPLCCCADSYFSNLLISHGANVDYADKDNWTPLHQAVHNADYAVAVSLLDAGAKVDVRTTDDGLSVLERARDIPDRQVFERFVKLLEVVIRDRELEKARILRAGDLEEREERRMKSDVVEEVEGAEVAEEAEDVGGQFEIV